VKLNVWNMHLCMSLSVYNILYIGRAMILSLSNESVVFRLSLLPTRGEFVSIFFSVFFSMQRASDGTWNIGCARASSQMFAYSRERLIAI